MYGIKEKNTAICKAASDVPLHSHKQLCPSGDNHCDHFFVFHLELWYEFPNHIS